MKYFESIHSYLEGDLDEGARKEFEDAMQEDELLRNEVELHREVDLALAETDVISLRGKLKEIHKRVTNPEKETRILRLRPRQAIYSIAAVALLLIASAWIFNLLRNPSMSTDQIYAMYYQPDDAMMVMRSSGSGDAESMFEEALRKYESQDFEGALQLFKKDNSSLMVHFYSGLAYMEINHFNEAILSFQTILDDQQNLFIEQAQWYQGLCYMKTDQNDKARHTLSELNIAGSPYQIKVEYILKKLKK